MAATIVIAQNYGESYGGYSGEVAKNTFYLIDEDSGILSKETNPLRRPDTGTTYSFEIWLRARCDVAPTTQCFNFKVWYDSGLPSGYTLTANSDEVSSYSAPVDVISTQGTRVDFTTKVSELNSIPLSGTLVNIGDYTSWIVFQLELSPTAVLGDQTVDFILQYDEV